MSRASKPQCALDDLAKSMQKHLCCVHVYDAVSDKYTKEKYRDLHGQRKNVWLRNSMQGLRG
jgi:hypothetical protein